VCTYVCVCVCVYVCCFGHSLVRDYDRCRSCIHIDAYIYIYVNTYSECLRVYMGAGGECVYGGGGGFCNSLQLLYLVRDC